MSKEVLNLVPAIKSIEKGLNELAQRYNKKIQPYLDSFRKT